MRASRPARRYAMDDVMFDHRPKFMRTGSIIIYEPGVLPSLVGPIPNRMHMETGNRVVMVAYRWPNVKNQTLGQKIKAKGNHRCSYQLSGTTRSISQQRRYKNRPRKARGRKLRPARATRKIAAFPKLRESGTLNATIFSE